MNLLFSLGLGYLDCCIRSSLTYVHLILLLLLFITIPILLLLLLLLLVSYRGREALAIQGLQLTDLPRNAESVEHTDSQLADLAGKSFFGVQGV